jgi:hypothetical protein
LRSAILTVLSAALPENDYFERGYVLTLRLEDAGKITVEEVAV